MTQNIPYFKVLPSDPLILILSGLSGAGKDTVIEALKADPEFDFRFVVTMNTRPRRENEVDGVDYHFTSHDHFLEMIKNDELIEYAKVYEDYKGIPRFEIDQAFSSGSNILFRVDHQGTRKVRSTYPKAFSIFLLPPDSEIWSNRLISRGGDSDIRTRLETANNELNHLDEFDYLVVNDDLDQTIRTIKAIICAERCRMHRNHLQRTP